MTFFDWVLDHPVGALVVACEIAFWVFLAAAVAARYVLGRRRLSTVLLLCEPAIEVVLLVATVGDLVSGSEPTWTHGLAAVYLGYTVAFGRWTVEKVDAWVAWRFFDGPRPPRAPKRGRAALRHEWRLWLRVVLAWAVACGILGVLALIASAPEQRAVLAGWAGRATLVMVLWCVFGPVWQLFTDGDEPDRAELQRGEPRRTEPDRPDAARGDVRPGPVT
ncbi:hypothetical protein [Cellulomonas shaoxiangyii]|uniref:hypothetical protein n=1 Tax=Cellulomonas shaoxiangyii TaxID=2566013 RepID=UPI001AA03A19|nr:hypothetical protein [Cellulomonas shaoxiangyii]